MELTVNRRQPVIMLEDDDDDGDQPLELSDLKKVIDLIAGEDEDNAIIISDDDDNDDNEREISPASMQTSHRISENCEQVPHVICNGMTLRPGVYVELYDGDFLRVQLILYNHATGRTSLMGNLLRRNCYMDHMLEKQLNELCFIAQTPSNKSHFKLSDCLVTQELEDVVCIREVIATNQEFPSHSWRQTASLSVHNQKKSWKRTNLRLVVRWVKIEETIGNKIKRFCKTTVRTLSDEECDNALSADLTKRLIGFLGPERVAKLLSAVADEDADEEDDVVEVPPPFERPRKRAADHAGSEHVKHVRTETLTCVSSAERRVIKSTTTIKDVFATSKPQHQSNRVSQTKRTDGRNGNPPYPYHRYTLGEACAGAGGWACGARQAGVKHNFLIDNCPEACKTLRMNGFSEDGAKVIQKDVHDFVINRIHYSWEIVDTLHASYPCTAHSWANTRGGPKDEAALDLTLSLLALVDKCKPRIVTLEQVNAISQRRSGVYFKVLVHQLTSKGYSVSWKVEQFEKFGNPQARPRLIVVAACPGEELPPTIPQTHGSGPGMKPLVSMRSVLHKVAGFRGHVPEIMKHAIPRNLQPFSPDALRKGMITGNSRSHHPSGERDYSLQEDAASQTFPLHHKFFGGVTAIRLQIGNAVPPVFARACMENVVRSLQKSDRQIAAWKPQVHAIDD